MNLEQLTALGVTCVCGNLDFKGKNVGRLLAGGEVLITPEGEEFLAEFGGAAKPAPAAKKAAKKAAKPEPAAPAPEPEDDGLGDLLSDIPE